MSSRESRPRLSRHPYREIGLREAKPDDGLSLDLSLRITRALICGWSGLRVAVAVLHHRLGVEGALAAIVVAGLLIRWGSFARDA
jgi:hypothetical protein